MFYLVVWLMSWATGLVSLRNWRDPYPRWNTLLCFTGGCYSLSWTFQSMINPAAADYEGWGAQTLRWAAYILSEGSLLFFWHMIAYAFLMNAIAYLRAAPSPLVRFAPAVLLLYPLGTLVSHLLQIRTGLPVTFQLADEVKVVSGLYILAGCGLLIAGYIRNVDRQMKSQELGYVAIYLATMLVLYYDMLTLQSVTFNTDRIQVESIGSWQLHYTIFSLLIALNVVYGIFLGIWGIRVRIENRRYDNTMKTLSAGVTILNHTLKNELQKMKYLNERTISHLESHENGRAKEMLGHMNGIYDHLQAMLRRMKEQSDEIQLIEQEAPLVPLLDSVLYSFLESEGSRLQLIRQFEEDGSLFCDPIHIREVLGNVCRNALEAIPSGEKARLQIGTRLCGNGDLLIEISDNGCGIPPEHIHKVFEPFYTTKKMDLNYGLGLSYCFNVMQKHGGLIRISGNMAGKGTTVELRFPAKRYHRHTAQSAGG